MFHGGLGRLAYFAPEPDYDTAREHFSENLRLSENIGSLIGQTKMHSLLASCDIAEKKYADAQQHFAAAYGLAAEQVDQMFALAGLIESHSLLDQISDAGEHLQLLVEIVQARLADLPEKERNDNPVAAIPGICRDNITRALAGSTASQPDRSHRWLSELIDNNQTLPD